MGHMAITWVAQLLVRTRTIVLISSHLETINREVTPRIRGEFVTIATVTGAVCLHLFSDLTIIGQPHDTPTSLRSGRHSLSA